MLLTAVLIPAPEGGFTALNPETGSTSQGETVEEVECAIREAFEYHHDGMHDDGVSVPSGSVRWVDMPARLIGRTAAPDRRCRLGRRVGAPVARCAGRATKEPE